MCDSNDWALESILLHFSTAVCEVGGVRGGDAGGVLLGVALVLAMSPPSPSLSTAVSSMTLFFFLGRVES